MTRPLQVPSLAIEHFRGIRALELPALGRVTLLAGNNGVGKTTVLDAIRFYASRGDARILVNVLDTREEFVPGIDEEGNTAVFPDFASLFHGNHDTGDAQLPIRIRSRSKGHDLAVHLLENDTLPIDAPFHGDEPRNIKIFLGQRNRTVAAGPLAYYNPSGLRFPNRNRTVAGSRNPRDWPTPIPNESLGPGTPDNANLARLWDALALTEGEDLAIQALRLVVGDVERITLVGNTPGATRPQSRRAVVKLESSAVPIPLKRLGDGANRLFAIALALASSRGGLLLVDEAENGIHHSVHARLWRMVFQAAVNANAQVVAATHSWDCIKGFARAAVESNAEGTLYRLERFQDNVQAIPYSEEDLQTAAAQGIEVR